MQLNQHIFNYTFGGVDQCGQVSVVSVTSFERIKKMFRYIFKGTNITELQYCSILHTLQGARFFGKKVRKLKGKPLIIYDA